MMVDNRKNKLLERKKIATEIAEQYIKSSALSNIILIGDHGTGKKFIIQNIVSNLSNVEQFAILEFKGDQIIEKNKKLKTVKKQFSFELSVYLGISISAVEDNTSKLNYFLNSLKKIKQNKVIIVVPDICRARSEVKDIMRLICENKEYIEVQSFKHIGIIMSGTHSSGIAPDKFNVINLAPYEAEDIKTYLMHFFHVVPANYSNFNEKIERLTEITNSDMDLVNLIYKDILDNALEYSVSLHDLISRRLEKMKEVSHQQEVSPKDLEEIILTCSLSLECFTKFFISKTTNRTEEIVNDSILISMKEHLIKECGYNQYDFASMDVKDNLAKRMIQKHNGRLVDFYNYLSKYRSDEYFFRAYYLIKYTGVIDENAFSLIILTIARAFLFGDEWVIEEINSLKKDYEISEEIMENISYVIQAYSHYAKREYVFSNECLANVNKFIIGDVGKIELSRLRFRNLYMIHDRPVGEIDFVVMELMYSIENRIVLRLKEEFYSCEETQLKLRVACDIAPYLLDCENNHEDFENAYGVIKELSRKEQELNFSVRTSQYIMNVFNRKAFLFSSPLQSIVYYEQAQSFFYKNAIWDEYIITLICQAGSLLACTEYKQAIHLCEQALLYSEEKGIKIYKPEKLYNNMYIANFLLVEQETKNLEDVVPVAEKIILNLRELLNGVSCGTQHVLLTNIASLCLYTGKFTSYKETKHLIEQSLECDDVSDLKDSTINDFYRYYFAWFELYYYMCKGDWAHCKQLTLSLVNFTPSLFIKQKIFLEKKNEAIQQLLKDQSIMNTYDFCNNLVREKRRENKVAIFFYRGLMVSDIQYTSYD